MSIVNKMKIKVIQNKLFKYIQPSEIVNNAIKREVNSYAKK